MFLECACECVREREREQEKEKERKRERGRETNEETVFLERDRTISLRHISSFFTLLSFDHPQLDFLTIDDLLISPLGPIFTRTKKKRWSFFSKMWNLT